MLCVCKLCKNCLTVIDQCAMVLKTPQFLQFSVNIFQVRNEFSPLLSKLVALIVNSKTRRRSNTLKGSQQRMGDRRIFLKIFRASLFNDDLSNEPDFGRIHFAGQYF
jgi:hypothetical protein